MSEPPSLEPQQPVRPRASLPDVLFALAGVALGAFVLWQSFALPVPPSYAQVSPQFFPLLVGAGLVVTSAWLLWRALRGERAEPATEEDSDPDAPTDWLAVVLIGVGIALQIALMNLLGFVLSSSILFVLTARAFRLKQPFTWATLVLDAVIAVVLAGVAFYGFTAGLELSLPVGRLFGGA
jgi:putative tricarboxylic transport membrane protein